MNDRRLLAGVCSALGARLGVGAIWLRLAALALLSAGGLGALLYALGWLLLPRAERIGTSSRRLVGRGAIEVGLGSGLLLAAVLASAQQLGVPFATAAVWPLVLVAGGGAVLWRQSRTALTPAPEHLPVEEVPEAVEAERTGPARSAVGVALVLAAAVVFLKGTGALDALRDVALVTLAVVVVCGVVFGPYVVRLVRTVADERAARIREQERAELAAHLHDSVLQTLALVQRRADDPREVAALARRQERELRDWLAGRSRGAGASGATTLRGALEQVAAEVEAAHGRAVEVVAVGDAPLDERGEALVAAAREAMVNAARHGGDGTVDVFAEAVDGRLTASVRDRGPGFDLATVPEDRRGVRESILGRMARHGGTASVRRAPGGGTEVTLEVGP